jgi:group I intron endonuclease
MSNTKSYIVYCIENIIDGKRYIGQSVRGKKRWNDHKNNLRKNKHENPYLQNAWNYYGEDNFIFSLLKTCDNQDELCYWENFYIKEFKTKIDWGCGYNLDEGGLGGPNPSLETREKMSLAKIGKEPWNKGIPASEEARNNLSESHKGQQSPMKGRTHTEESKKKNSESHKGKPSSNKGKKKSAETRQKMSISKKGRPSRNKGIPSSEESKRKNSDAHKGKTSPRKGVILTDETKNKISESRSGVQINGNKSSTGYFGVSKHKEGFVVNIQYKGVSYYLGKFSNIIEAALAYNEAAEYYYGFRAKLNQIPESEIIQLWEGCNTEDCI